MFGTGFMQGWSAMDQTVRGQQDYQLRREEMAARQKLQQQEFTQREKEFQWNQQASRQRTRLEAARMFNELVQANPSATADDIRAIAGQVYGAVGMSDAIPGNDHIERLANFMAERRRIADEDRKYQLLERQLRTQGVLSDLAGRAALSDDDPDKAYQNFVGAAGPLAGQLSRQQFEGIRNVQSRDFITRNLDTALKLAENGVPLNQYFNGAPPKLISSLEDAAKRRREEAEAEKVARLSAREQGLMLESFMKGVPYMPTPGTPDDVAARYKQSFEEMTARKEQTGILEFGDRVAGATDYVNRLLTGDERVKSEIVARFRAQFGREPTASEADQIMSRLNSAAESTRATTATSLLETIGKESEARALEAAKASRDTTLVLFGDKKNTEQFFGKDNLGRTVANLLETMVKDQSYTLNSNQLVAIGEELRKDKSLASAEQVTPDMVRAAMTRNPNIKAALDAAAPENIKINARQQAREGAGVYETSTADAFVASRIEQIRSDASTGLSKARSKIERVLSDPTFSPEQRVKELEAQLAKIAAQKEQIRSALERRLEPRLPWVRIGTRPFTQDDVKRITDVAEAEIAPAIEILTQAIEAAKKSAPAQPQPERAPDGLPTNPVDERARLIQRELGAEMPADMRARDLDRARAARAQEAEAAAKVAATRRAQQDARFQELATRLQDPNLPASDRTRLLQEINRIIDEYRK